MTVPIRCVVLLLALPAPAVAQNVAEVQVAPPSVTLKVGERTGLLATAFDRVGNVIPAVRVLWSSNNIQVARVDNNGTVTGLANGVAIIDARVGSRRGTAAVQVVGGRPRPAPGTIQAAGESPPAAPVTAPGVPAPDPSLAGQPAGTGPASVLRIEPPTIYLLPSENTRAGPRALKDDGSAAAPVPVTWKSLRPDIASVDQNGVVVALTQGQGTVQVTTANGLTATAPVVVQQTDLAIQEPGPIALSPGVTDTFHVVVPTQGGRVVSPLTVQWTSSDPTIVRVSMTGVATGVAPGRATVSVSGLLQTKSVDVVVHRPVDLLAVRPKWQEEVVLPIQGTAKFAAQALAADRTPVADAPLQWSVADSGLASFDPASGTLTGRKAGKTQLFVRGPGPGLVVTWTVRVIAAGVKLSAARIGIPPTRRFAVRSLYTDSAGTVIGPASGLTWTSENPQVATVSDDGTISGVSYGRTRVIASAPGGKRALIDVFVQGEIVLPSSRAGRFQLYAADRSNLTQWRKLLDDTTTATEPAFSPDGSRLAFTAARAIRVMDADGGNPVQVTRSTGTDGHAQFALDGNALVFQSDRSGHAQVWQQPLSGGEAVQLTREPDVNTQPAVSPDGETIAFVSTRGGATNLWLMAKDGSNQRPFTRSTSSFKSIEPRFLREAGTLFYLVQGKEGSRTVTQIMKAELASGKVTPVTGTDLVIVDFSVSPAGDLLALLVNVQGGGKPLYRVYIQPLLTSGGPAPLPTTGAEQMLTPAFMP